MPDPVIRCWRHNPLKEKDVSCREPDLEYQEENDGP